MGRLLNFISKGLRKLAAPGKERERVVVFQTKKIMGTNNMEELKRSWDGLQRLDLDPFQKVALQKVILLRIRELEQGGKT
ncbi:hypothetical protein KKH30_05005 [Candidatus Micrarchaeota archaeon]|nr:hypothetical protein [Candidatus Micrarchaeota archaeon]